MYYRKGNCMKAGFGIFFIDYSAQETQSKNYKGKTGRYTMNDVS